jgi:uncharacterized protein (TIGR02466 family)
MTVDVQDRAAVNADTPPRVKAAVMPLFSTWIYLCHDGPIHLNAQLEDLARRLMQEDRKGTRRTNDGGWHYSFDLFALDEPVVASFRDQIEQHVQAFLNQLRGDPHAARRDRFRLQGWINVNRAGDRNTLHCHPGCFLSGTYYVRTPHDMRGGEIVFAIRGDPPSPCTRRRESICRGSDRGLVSPSRPLPVRS